VCRPDQMQQHTIHAPSSTTDVSSTIAMCNDAITEPEKRPRQARCSAIFSGDSIPISVLGWKPLPSSRAAHGTWTELGTPPLQRRVILLACCALPSDWPALLLECLCGGAPFPATGLQHAGVPHALERSASPECRAISPRAHGCRPRSTGRSARFHRKMSRCHERAPPRASWPHPRSLLAASVVACDGTKQSARHCRRP